MNVEQLVNEMSLNPRRLFLIDSLGALLSIFLLGFVLVQLESFIGMPKSILYKLAIAPCFFAVYSFICYWRLPKNWRFFLKIIALANLIYCCVSIMLVFYHFEQLTQLGLVYFLGELIVLIALIYLELKTAVKT